MNFLTELKNRWTQKSPIFFQKLQSFGVWATGVSVSLIGLTEIPCIQIPEIVPQIAGYLAAIGAVIAIVSKLTVKDPDYRTLDVPK